MKKELGKWILDMDTNYLIFVAMMIVGVMGVAVWATWYDKTHNTAEE